MNCIDVIFFQAELAPEKLAIVAQGQVLSYGRLAHGIVSAQRRFTAAGLVAGQTVGVQIMHPIDYFVVACALFRMKIAVVSVTATPNPHLDAIRFDAFLTNAVNPAMAQKQPAAKLFLVDTSWFQDEITFSVDQRASATRDVGEWTARLACDADGKVITTSASSLEAQLLGYSLSAPPDWERMITMHDPYSDSAFLLGLSALYQGRTVAFADAPTARNLIVAYGHHFLVGEVRDFANIILQQKAEYLPLTALRGAYIEGGPVPVDVINDALSLVSSNTVIAYRHPQVGTVAYGPAGRLKEHVGAVGFVASWMDVGVVDAQAQPVPTASEGNVRLRRRADMQSLWRVTASGATGDEWVHPGRRGRRLANNMLVLS